MKKKIFKWVPGFEGLYQCSNYGDILSFQNNTPRLLKPAKDKDGYLKVSLSKEKKTYYLRVHRIVALTFIPNPDNLPFVNHKDENVTNNYVENLEWCTAKYNTNYGTCIKRRASAKCRAVYKLSPDRKTILEKYPSVKEAAKQNNVRRCYISAVLTGVQYTAGGYAWAYA